jgi:hypothetical protein
MEAAERFTSAGKRSRRSSVNRLFGRNRFSMSRLSAGLISGIVGAVILIGLSFVQVPFVGLLVVLAVGVVAGILVARNPKFAGKTGGAGALAGLTAGGVLFVGSILASVIALNSPEVQSTINQAVETAQATINAGGSSTTSVDVKSIAQVAVVFGGCIGGLLYLGLSTGLGAAAGAIAGRNTQAPTIPMDSNYPTFGAPPAGYPQQPGYPPQQGYPPPQSPYGSQQGGYPPQQPPPQQQ